jgi:cation:H+ antiporter
MEVYSLFTNILLLLLGLILLYIGAEGFIRGASGIAHRFHISEYVIGATLVALGTSLPEAVTSSYASWKGVPDISLSNVIGSNIFNISLVLGIAGFLMPIRLKRDIFKKDAPYFFFSVVILFLLSANGEFSQIEGLIFLILFAHYVYNLLREREKPTGETPPIPHSFTVSMIFLIGGSISVYLGSKFAVESAVSIAKIIGISQWVIGATVIAVGTSLPEFATTLVALRKEKSAIAVGNVIGSNITNVYLVVGAASVISPLSVSKLTFQFDIPYLILLTLFLILIINDKEISRSSGLLLLISFVGYIFAIIQVHH